MNARALPVLLLCALALAGCSDPKAEASEEEADFSDKDIQVSDTTGAIRGLVVDERIVPVAEAAIQLTGAAEALSTTSDDQGRFVFDQLPAGTYFLSVSHPLHKAIQAAAEVEAGNPEPPLTRIQLERLFKADPFVVGIQQDGFFECSAAAPINSPWYASATCMNFLLGPRVMEIYPEANNITKQEREWHMNVDAGWKTIVVEIDWAPTGQSTSGDMGIVLSTYKPTRNGAHWFMNYQSGPPLRTQLDVGVEHDTAANVEPTTIPAEGMVDVSYFVGVRPGDLPYAVALNQDFKVYIHQFYYLPAPDGWSLVAGDVPPY